MRLWRIEFLNQFTNTCFPNFTILFPVLNGILNYYAITRFGIIGAAIVTSSLFWISGITSLLLFYRYLKQLD